MSDVEEFDAFYADTSWRVLGQLWTMTGSRAEAEDAVAEAYARAWQRWRQVRECDSPEAWVRRTASRIAISTWRKAVNRMRAHHRATPDQELAGLGPDHVALVHALRQIPAEQRRAIVLHHLVGLSVAEVAAEVGAPQGTIKARLLRGRRALAGWLGDLPDPAHIPHQPTARTESTNG
ncbi:sigma-70 family RNA polymerase sigma factor [Catellatospora citrea]|uniref:RNA polymerase sigma24 factor n=1 Tax=Catellatospora citrea TaxID=53366 RepID=A0A8J3P3T8_9ACTN|nr:sigma-70 family RNA polymerase sigma factor [Catellatospora citrea]RKE12043.1 RNA polymerase sigma-70 factor (ECF subfamily) [Catellatospora citrea]GIG02986.1 RNA polymerase sigma24 factor [Catellatospora citrea]